MDGLPYAVQNGIVIADENHRRDLCRKKKFQAVLGKLCSTKTLKKRLPILTWLPAYNIGCLAGDSVAGITVALLVIPQAIAYGIVAGLSPNYGLYSAFMGCFVYFVFGTTKELSIGPTAIMSLMTLHYSSQGGADYAVFLCFMAGIIELIAGIINLGFLINFISVPVISGFMSAAALTIASSQLKGLFGLKLTTNGIFDTWFQVFSHIAECHWPDFVLGLCCIFALTFMKQIASFKWPCLGRGSETPVSLMKSILFFLTVGRNALIILIASSIAFGLDGKNQPFTLTGEVTPGLPPARVPPFSTTVNNVTMNFIDIIGDIGIGVVMVPFIAILDNIAVISAYTKGSPFDATQEIIALGVVNVLGAFFSSIPTTASLSRTALNNASGVRTPAGGLITGLIVLLALAFITPFFKFIPKAALSSVIVCAVVSMVEYEIILPMWRSRRQDVIPLAVTFIACLVLGLEWGILTGIGVNLSLMLYDIATPLVTTSVNKFPGSDYRYVLVTPSNGIYFPSRNHIMAIIMKAGIKEGDGKQPIIVDCSAIHTMDFTSAEGVKDTVDAFGKRNQVLMFLNVHPKVQQTINAIIELPTCESVEDAEVQLKAMANEKDLKSMSLMAQCVEEGS